MSKLNDALDPEEYELAVEAVMRLREIKVQAWRQAQQLPATQSFSRADFGIERIDALLAKLDVTIKEDTVPYEPPAPRIGIKIEGGVIQSVFSNQDAQIYVIHYDKDDIADAVAHDGYQDEDAGICQLEQDGGHFAECLLQRYGAELAPSWFPRMDAALTEHAQQLRESEGGGMKP